MKLCALVGRSMNKVQEGSITQSLEIALYAVKQSLRLNAASAYDTPAQNPFVSLLTLKVISVSGIAGKLPGFDTAQVPGQP